MLSSSLTIIDNENLRGIIAPSQTLSKERLVDIVDLIELSTPESSRETQQMIAEADNQDAWVSLSQVKQKSENLE